VLSASLLWTAAWWAIGWTHIPLLSEHAFFPLWLGYIATINAASEAMVRDSLMRKMGWSFVSLFVISIPMWWFFEFVNLFVQNWHYLFGPVSSTHYVIETSIDFSTVVPTVLSTAFVFRRLAPREGHEPSARRRPVAAIYLVLLAACGIACFVAVPYAPNETFPLVWLAPLLVIDPINRLLGFPSVLAHIRERRWRTPASLMAAALFAGFWWEMWNFYSYPKWYYTIPYVGFWKIFEMPLLGYVGYPFFGLIVWSYAVLALTSLNRRETEILRW
jgi:hypothetical protein